jgi:hypothetical protein
MVGASMNDLHINIRVVGNDVSEASCSPWVKITVGKHNVRHMKEISVRVASAEAIKGPVKLGVKPVGALTLAYKAICVP